MVIVAILPDFLIYKIIKRYSSASRRKLNITLWVVFTLLCWVDLCALIFYPKRNPDVSVLPAMWMLYSWLSIYIPKILFLLCAAIGMLFMRKGGNKPNRGIIPGIVLATITFIVMWCGVLSTRYVIDVTRIEISSPKIPQSFDGFKVVQFSDAHVGTWGSDTTFVSTLVDSINALNPDLILFTGDVVNRQSSEIKPFLPVFARLKASKGVHIVFGNHDYSSYVDWPKKEDENADHLKLWKMLEGIGWNVYSNSHSFISNSTDSIALIGVDNWGEPPFNRLGDLAKSYPAKGDTIHSLHDSLFKILMTHNPNHWVNVVKGKSNIDLTLSGHTHAMQMMTKAGSHKWSPAKWVYPNWGGLYQHSAQNGDKMLLYVNIGAGEVGFPARLGAAYPEITLFTLRHSEK